MRLLLTFGVLTLLSLNSCSSKNESPKTHIFPGPAPVRLLDADRDGLSDPFEKKIGTNASVASFPSFTNTGKIQTRLTLSQKSIDTKEITWHTPQDSDTYAINRPHRIQMAKQAFKRKFKFEKSDHVISFSPLPKFNITKILFHQWHEFNSFPLLKNTTLSLETTIPVKLVNFKGIEKLNKISARVGFYEKDHFIPLTNHFILKDETGTALSLGKKKDSAIIFLNINIESKELIKKLLQNKKQIILELCDFKATTQESSDYVFSEQWNYANEALRPLLITTPEKDQLVLVDKYLDFKDALKQVTKDFKLNSEEEIESLGRLNNAATNQTSLSEMDSLQLQEHSWFEFKQENLYALAYLSNFDLAHADHELITDNIFKIKGSNSKEDLGKLRIGEVLSFSFKGSYSTAHPMKVATNEHVTYQTYITQDLVPSFPEPSIVIPERILIEKPTTCTKITHQTQWISEKIHSPSIIYFETSTGEVIQLTDLYEVTKARPISNKSNDEFELHFTITEDFLHRYGDKLKLRVRDMRVRDQFEIGTIDFICPNKDHDLPSHFEDQYIDKHSEYFEQNNDIQLKFNKRF